MFPFQRFLVRVALPLCVAGVAGVAFAQAYGTDDTTEGIDDPKLERRLGTRVELAQAAAVASAPGAAAAPAPSHLPHLMLAYRRFSFAQIGPTAISGPSTDEPFNVVSLDLYPISSSWRFVLSTQYGWEEGTFRANGDAFIAQSAALGGQIPGEVFTPFFEAYAGGGYMQRTHAGLNTIATAYGQLGVDVGTELFLARHAFLSAAVGYIHATNGFAKNNAFGSFSVDTWSFKLGFGL